MAAGSVRFRSTYYNTTGDPIEWQIDVLDTEPVAQIIKFESTEPVISFEGLTQDLKPGIYPSTLKFGFFVRDTIFTKGGVNYGPSASIISDLLTSNEGRFRVKVYRDGALYYCGIILPDQCQYEDEASPYLLSITAADGLYRWKDRNFIVPFGKLEYVTLTEDDYDNGPAYKEDPLTDGLVGTEWVMIEHYSIVAEYSIDLQHTYTATTYARHVQYLSESPGDGWVLQDNGLWAKEATYDNEVITTVPGAEGSYYHLTRDLTSGYDQPLNEIIEQLMPFTGLVDEYPSPVVMWDTASEWYENSMGDKTADPFTQIKLNNKELIDGDIWEAIEEMCKLLYLRVYYSKGRYHFEQLSYRDVATFKRFLYQSDGTAAGSESVNLDIDMAADGIRVAAGGSFRILAPLHIAECKIKLADGNLMAGEVWRAVKSGQRYLGRISRQDGTQRIRLELRSKFRTRFDGLLINALGDDAGWMSANSFNLYIQLRFVDTASGITYYMDADDDLWTTVDDATLGSSVATINKTVKVPESPSSPQFNDEGRNMIEVSKVHVFTTDSMPGAEGATYDFYLSINYSHQFASTAGGQYWQIENPTGYYTEYSTFGSLLFVDASDQEIGVSAEKVYYVNNDTNNTLKITNEVIWADTERNSQNIEIYNGSEWVRSQGWSVGGVGTAQPILALCASEIMSLRLSPKRLYSGQFISAMIEAESRILRGTKYYLPIRCELNTDVDGVSGEFVEIAKTTPPAVDLIDIPPDESNDETVPIGDGGGAGPDDQPLAFETDEEIAASSTLTECAIVNTQGYYVGPGSAVKILNTTNGNNELVTLSQEINPLDTTMYFYSHTFEHSYPDGSPIILDGIVGPPPSGPLVFMYNNHFFTGNEFYVAQLDWTYFNTMPRETFTRKVKLKRNGVEMLILYPGDEPPTNTVYYRIDKVETKFTFDGTSCLPFVEEWLQVDIDLTR